MSMPALGPGNGDVAYRMQGLRHTPAELELDEPVPARTLIRLWLRAAVPAFLVGAAFAFLALLVFLAAEPSPFRSETPGAGLFTVGSLLSIIIFGVVLLAARVDEPIAAWQTLLEDRWQSADSAYAAIYGTLRRRAIPVEATAVRVRSDLLSPEVVNNRLRITDRGYQLHVSVFPYGSSLYLGWTMGRSRRGATLIGHFLKDLAGGMAGRATPITPMLRTERVRALREAVHAAVREGAEVASQGLVVPLAPTFGAEVPIQDLRAQAAPPAYGPPPGYGTPPPTPMPSGYAPDSFAPPPTTPSAAIPTSTAPFAPTAPAATAPAPPAPTATAPAPPAPTATAPAPPAPTADAPSADAPTGDAPAAEAPTAPFSGARAPAAPADPSSGEPAWAAPPAASSSGPEGTPDTPAPAKPDKSE
ncbi:hypothetical protein BJY16_008768 [Actinoplanes octamycinicus]|uniref:Uncharacterized protein n=1 Tax=Actinoplanes octamycinicus TaxID=135948 RepID=A0A7W7MCM8_9ACTN|nr:Got1/Sft2-like family vesicle transport protein [Actinoplanes octamycinicus]MBB4745309.1 hypothetical protein [Actinoplanes octamycinicus]